MSGGVEVNKIARPDIDRARAEARHPGIEAIEIHQALQRVLEVPGIVEAGRPERPAGLQPRRHGPRGEESCCAEHGSQIGAHLIEEIACVLASGEIDDWIA